MKERELIIKLFLSLFFLTFFNQQIDGSIIEIIQNIKYPIVFNGNDENYNIITSGTLLTLEKKTNKVINQKSIISYDPPFFIFIDDSNALIIFYTVILIVEAASLRGRVGIFQKLISSRRGRVDIFN